ncbi:Uncharacterised protein r2_g3724 [Pycnogonum litorale]
MNEENVTAKSAMKIISKAYLGHREISSQEAVYKLLSLRMKEFFRKVQFIPVGENPVRLSLPLSVLKARVDNEIDIDLEDIWMKSIIERYKNRPKSDTFDCMCLATFCSEYRQVYTKTKTAELNNSFDYVDDEKLVDKENAVIKLNNNCGYVQKRTRTKLAVIRYPRFFTDRDSEKKYHSILHLFLPFRIGAQLKPDNFLTHEEFYKTGCVKLKNEIDFVKNIVERNKAPFEVNSEAIDNAEKVIEEFGIFEDAWAKIAPEAEQERDFCKEMRENGHSDDENDGSDHIPDLSTTKNISSKVEIYSSLFIYVEYSFFFLKPRKRL